MTKPRYPSFDASERELLENHLEHNRLAVRHNGHLDIYRGLLDGTTDGD